MKIILSLPTLVAVLFATALVETRAQSTISEAEQEAIEKIESAGGSVRRVARQHRGGFPPSGIIGYG